MRRRWVFAVLLCVALVGGIGAYVLWRSLASSDVPQAQAPQLSVPDRAEALTLVRGTMEDFSQALVKKDFADFHASLSALWRRQTNPQKIAEAFGAFLPFAREVRRAVRNGDPTMNAPPRLEEDGILVLQGFYRIEATKMLFTLKYVYDAPQWKLLGLDVFVK